MTAVNGKKTFGAGRFFGINNVTNPTPARFGVPQDMTISFKRGVKSLFGERQLAEDVSGGELEVTGKVTMGVTNARIFTDLLFGTGGATGQTLEADKESGTVPMSSSYIVTVANSTTWSVDLGVVNAVTGVPLTRVASSPTGNQYSVAAGVYTFPSTMAGVNVQISYLYTSSTAGETVLLTNQAQGNVGNFTAVMAFLWRGEQDVLTLNNCIGSDTEIATKGGDYAKPSFGFTAACDSSGNLGTFSFAEAA